MNRLPTFKFSYTVHEEGDFGYLSVNTNDLAGFSPALLGLGDISTEGERHDALAAIFDLQGFTQFCSQLDPHLVVPEYLSKFLAWLFDSLRKEATEKEIEGKTVLWGKLPFFHKFMGDGVLFLWDVNDLYKTDIGNIVVNLLNVCKSYDDEFYPAVVKHFSQPPTKLRCGIARGQVIAIGNGEDFVGPCINMAARLQKLGSLTFAISRRGFDPVEYLNEEWHDTFIVKKTSIRGISKAELVCVVKEQFRKLPQGEKTDFI